MDIYEALYTTRAMRRIREGAIPEAVQKKILDAAIRAPTGGNSQQWRFGLVDDPGLKAKLGVIYRGCMKTLWADVYGDRIEAAKAKPEDPESRTTLKMQASAQWLADNFERYPLFLFAFSRGPDDGGSIFPAVWSAMLAARAEGVGSALTSVFLFQREQVQKLLGMPQGKDWSFRCCVSFGYPTGRWGVAPRRPVHEVAFRNQFDAPVGFEILEPLWQPGKG